jgi:plasmid stabilization system protein ParE
MTAMALGLYINPEAEADLTAAALWYAEQDPERDLGLELLQEFTDVLDQVRDNPFLFVVYDGSVRRALLRRFPYAVYYETETDRIVVLAFMHMKREPDVWREQ